MYIKDKERRDKMKMKGWQWRSLTMAQRLKLLEIAADQNWMGRNW
jgi:hypothetical protein